MLSKLFKGRNPLAAARAEKRLDAIAALNPDKAASLRDELAACALGDADLRVRRAALAWIDDSELLESLLDDNAVSDGAADRLAQLGANMEHPAVRQARMRVATSVEEAAGAASGVTAPEALAALFLCCPEPYRDSLLPAVRLLGEPGLAVLERQSRNHDKLVNRTARAELDLLRTSRRTVDELYGRAEELKAALARETAGTAPGRPRELLRTLEACLGEIEENAPTLARYGLQAPSLAALRVTVDAPAPVAVAAEPDLPGFDVLTAGLRALDERMVAGEPLDDLKETHDELTGNWLAQADRTQPDRDQRAVFETVTHRYRELAEATDRQGNLSFAVDEIPQEIGAWPQSPDALQALWKQQRDMERTQATLQRQLDAVGWPAWAPAPAPLRRLTEAIAQLRQSGQCLTEHQHELAEELASLIDKTESSVAEGRLKPAQSSLGQARKIARSLPERTVRRHRKALQAAVARVEELQDWQAFATSPKRRELLDSMRALAAQTPANAKDRADRIKALRTEWNALGPFVGTDARTMQAEFNRLAEQAFEPCRAHFNAQAELRKRNLAERRLICEQLEQYLDNIDWARADMRAAEQIMRTAREEWRRFHPVDRRHAKALDSRFEALQERIFTQLKRVWDANLAAKQAIVAAAEKLAAGEASIADKVQEAKALQRRWREVGTTPRKPDQKLWRQFREQCDLIFQARESGRKQAGSELESAIAEAERICDSMQEAVAEANPATANRATLARLRGELNALSLPERWEKPLHRRFDEAARNYNQLILAGEMDNLCRELENLKAWDIDVSRAEASGAPVASPGDAPPGSPGEGSLSRTGTPSDTSADGSLPSEGTPERSLAESSLPSTGSPSRSPAAGPPPASLFAGRAAEGEEPLPALRRLTVEAELLAGVESPPGDRQLRLEVQVDALNQSMGRRAAEKEPREFAEAWCRLGPKSEASDVLRERFFSALLRLARPHEL